MCMRDIVASAFTSIGVMSTSAHNPAYSAFDRPIILWMLRSTQNQHRDLYTKRNCSHLHCTWAAATIFASTYGPGLNENKPLVRNAGMYAYQHNRMRTMSFIARLLNECVRNTSIAPDRAASHTWHNVSTLAVRQCSSA